MKDYSVLEGLDNNFMIELRCAYDRGYRHGRDDEWAETKVKESETKDEGYNRGLESAWSCAKRIMSMPLSDQEKIFNMQDERAIMDAHSAEEAIDILKRYDEKNDDIKVGDKVRTLKGSDGIHDLFPIGTVGIVEIVDKEDELKYKVSADGDYWWYRRDMIELVKDDEIEVGDVCRYQTCERIFIITSIHEGFGGEEYFDAIYSNGEAIKNGKLSVIEKVSGECVEKLNNMFSALIDICITGKVDD